MSRLLLAFGLWLGLTVGAWAQNPTCPTRPLGDATNACADTAFVANALTNPSLVLPNGTTATTQAPADSTTKVATDAYVENEISRNSTHFSAGGTTTGSANAQVISTVSPPVFSLTGNPTVTFIAGFSNLGATTLNVASTGVISVLKKTPAGLVALVTGDLISGQQYFVTYDGTQYELQTPSQWTNAQLAQMAANTVKCNNTGAGATPIDCTQAQLTALVNVFTSGLSGSVPASGGGTSNFLRADGTFAAPAGGLSGTSAVSGASTTYTSGQNNLIVKRSNSGASMSDTLPGTGAGVLPANTYITVMNIDTAGVLAVSVASGAVLNSSINLFNGFLYLGPGQTAGFFSDGSNYFAVGAPARAKLAANTTVLISASGNDSTANGLTTAFLTTTKAWTFAQAIIDHNGFVVTYSHATGNYALNTTLIGPQVGSCGAACDILQGNTGTPANVTYGAATGVQLTIDNASVQVQGFQFNAVTGQIFVATNNAVVNWQSNITQASTASALTAVNGGVLNIIGNYQAGSGASSNESVHWNANDGGHIRIAAASITITVAGSPAWGSEFALVQTTGTIFFDFIPTFSGASSGTRCAATLNGVINTGGNLANLPGNAACSAGTSGGQEN